MMNFFKQGKLLVVVLLIFSGFLSAQNTQAYQIKYAIFNNNQRGEKDYECYFFDNILYMSPDKSKTQRYINFNTKESVSIFHHQDSLYKWARPFSEFPKGTLSEEREKILGYRCKRMDFVYFSNHISVWFTEKAPCRGTPFSQFLPSPKALVLKAVVNGNYTLTAEKIEKVKHLPYAVYSDKNARTVNEAEFEELKIKSRFTSLKVFDNCQIHFAPDLYKDKPQELLPDSVYHFSKGSVILKKVALTDKQMKSAFVFARLTASSNGDAYDRTGSVFILPDSLTEQSLLNAYLNGVQALPKYKDNQGNEYQGIVKTENYTPPLELMRFFTPFGVGHFNEKRRIHNYDWEEEAVYKQDVSDVFPMAKSFWVGVFIGNYDGGGHEVSLDLEFFDDLEEKNLSQNVIIPLVSTINTMEMSGQNYGRLFDNDTLRVEFEVPEGVRDLKFLYTSTGHGGWGGGDEFNPKRNRIMIDGNLFYEVTPWRSDCATYRLLNPASGNFENGLSSSDLSRSNWCPGTLTPPCVIPAPLLKAGKHYLEIIIDQGAPEGNSFSHWGLSLILQGEKR